MIRVGIGYDSHRFAPPGPLVLGGVSIPSDVHLAGHSDGDAVAHALTDAILGAAGAGDIGEMFPDTDPANAGPQLDRDADGSPSREIKASAGTCSRSTSSSSPSSRASAPPRRNVGHALAVALEVKPGEVSIKGKSNEGMGWIGRGEGLACMAVATLTNDVAGCRAFSTGWPRCRRSRCT